MNQVEVKVSPETEATTEQPEGPRVLPLLTDKRAGLGAGGVIHDTPQGDGKRNKMLHRLA